MTDAGTRSSSELDERCEALLAYIRGWRCTRRGHSPADQHGVKLCAQHRYHGAKIPARWEHPVLPNGVVSCVHEGPMRRWIGMKYALASGERLGPL